MDAKEPTLEQLAAYVLGELNGSEAARVQSFMQRSPAMAKKADRLGRLIATLEGDDTAAPAAFLIKRVVAMFGTPERLVTSEPSPINRLRQVVARLVFNSRSQPVLAGFRGAVGHVQLAFETDGGTIDLQILPAKDPLLWKLRGQASFDAAPSSASALSMDTQHDQRTEPVDVDEHGRFDLLLPAGRYDLHLQTREHVVVMPDLHVG